MFDSHAPKWINQLGVPQDIVHTPEKVHESSAIWDSQFLGETE